MAVASDRLLSRRALAAGTLGALGALIGAAIARPLPVDATAQSISLLNDENGDTIFRAESRHTSAPSSGGGTAVFGISNSGVGAAGSSTSNYGVQGHSVSNVGVLGGSGNGGSSDSTGVMGVSGVTTLVPLANTGVYGLSHVATGVGVAGTSALGRGGQFSGRKAQLRLMPSNAASHPSTGAKGDLFVDASGRLWFYTGATWKRIQLV